MPQSRNIRQRWPSAAVCNQHSYQFPKPQVPWYRTEKQLHKPTGLHHRRHTHLHSDSINSGKQITWIMTQTFSLLSSSANVGSLIQNVFCPQSSFSQKILAHVAIHQRNIYMSLNRILCVSLRPSSDPAADSIDRWRYIMTNKFRIRLNQEFKFQKTNMAGSQLWWSELCPSWIFPSPWRWRCYWRLFSGQIPGEQGSMQRSTQRTEAVLSGTECPIRPCEPSARRSWCWKFLKWDDLCGITLSSHVKFNNRSAMVKKCMLLIKPPVAT